MRVRDETGIAVGGAFPLGEALEAFEGFLRRPTEQGRDRATNALETILLEAGARGAYLELDVPSLGSISLGAGSLPDRAATAVIDATSRHALTAADGRAELGTLWLDAPVGSSEAAVRILRLALDAVWSRAEVSLATERLAALDVAIRGIAGVLEVDEVLELIVHRVRDLVGAGYAALGIVDDRGIIERFVTVGISDEVRERIGHPPRGHGLLGLIIREGRSFRIPEISAHPDSSGFPANHPPMHSFLGVPVTVKGVSVGNLYLTDKADGREFSAADQRLVEMFALHAGIAIDSARLSAQIQRLVIVDERERIGKDLHDGIIQNIYAVGLSLEETSDMLADDPAEARARIDRAIDSLHTTIRDIRNFIMGLRPELLDQHDLLGSLDALAEQLRVSAVIDVETEVDPATAAAVPDDLRPAMFHIARESLSNVARHSRARRAWVRLATDGDAIRLEIADDGVGFDAAADRAGSHQGLPNMGGRAARHGGRLEIDSAAGRGTRIIATFPRASARTAAAGTGWR